MLRMTLPFPPHPSSNEMDHMHPVACYLGPEGLEAYLTHPYASPLFGTFDQLPPLLIQSGDAEVLRDEIMLLEHKARCAGVEVCHEMYEDAVHVFQMFPFLECSRKAFSSFRHFVHSVLPINGSLEPIRLNLSTERKLDAETRNARSTLVSGVGEPESPASSTTERAVASEKEEADHNPLSRDSHCSSIHPFEEAVHLPVLGEIYSARAKSSDDLQNSFKPVPGFRHKTKSHPDIQALCREWKDNNEAIGISTVYRRVSTLDVVV